MMTTVADILESNDQSKPILSLNPNSDDYEEQSITETQSLIFSPSDFSAPIIDSIPYAGTNVSANSGCHQCC